MILPTKHVRLSNSLLGVSAEMLKRINRGTTITSLWNDVRLLPEVRTFERFTLSLDLLYSMGVVEFEDGLLRRKSR